MNIALATEGGSWRRLKNGGAQSIAQSERSQTFLGGGGKKVVISVEVRRGPLPRGREEGYFWQ